MQADNQTVSSRTGLWAGRIAGGLAVLFLLFDSAIKLAQIPPVIESFTRLGYPASLSVAIGTLELICLVVYLIPRVAIFGALLLTGFLGGAVATHVRVQDPLFSHVLFPTYVGILLWAGLWLRNARLRALIPAQRSGR